MSGIIHENSFIVTLSRTERFIVALYTCKNYAFTLEVGEPGKIANAEIVFVIIHPTVNVGVFSQSDCIAYTITISITDFE